MKRLPHYLILVAAALVVIGVIYKILGYGYHNVGPLLVTPDAFLRFSNTLLFFSVAVNVQRALGAKPLEAPKEAQPAPPAAGS